MTQNKPLVSVIIPIYAVEKYLEECVDSVLRQTYKNLEIILVDDGSPDRCGEIADVYAQRDGRVSVIHQRNGGLSDARNVGIRYASGDYLFFLDSDDYIADDAIEGLLNTCLNENVEIAVSGLTRFDNNVEKNSEEVKNKDSGVVNEIKIYNRVDGLKAMLLQNEFGHEVPGKLYLASLWKDISFPLGKLYEDYATTYKLFLKANKIALQRENIYFYRSRLASIMTSEIKEKNLMLLDISETVTMNICKEVPELKLEAKYLQARTGMKLMEGILTTGTESFLGAQARIMDFIKKEGKFLLRENCVRKTDKIKLVSLLMSKRLFMVAYYFGEKKNLAKLKRGKG